jgi:hypothetical protein
MSSQSWEGESTQVIEHEAPGPVATVFLSEHDSALLVRAIRGRAACVRSRALLGGVSGALTLESLADDIEAGRVLETGRAP